MKIFLLLASLLAVPLLHADEASKAAKAGEFIVLARLEAGFNQMIGILMGSIKQGMNQQLRNVPLSPAQQVHVEDFQSGLERLFRERFNWESMKGEYQKLYAAAFTEEDLDAMLAFYRSPAGQRMVEKNPELMEKAALLGQERAAGLQPDIERLAQELMTKLAGAQAAP